MRFTGDLQKMKKNSIFRFSKVFLLRQMGFLLFLVMEKWFSSLNRMLSGIFWRCKIDEILTIMSFFSWFSLWYCLFGFLFKSSQLSSLVFAKHGIASVSIFEINWKKNRRFILGYLGYFEKNRPSALLNGCPF